MDHTIFLTVDGAAPDELAGALSAVDGLAVGSRVTTGGLALDPGTISLLVAGLGSVNTLIAALAGVWVAKLKERPTPAPAPARPVIHLHTDLDSVRVTLTGEGDVLEISGPLPESVEDIVEATLTTEPA